MEGLFEEMKSQDENWQGFLCTAAGGSSGTGSSGKGFSDWRELDMLKLNKPIRQPKSLEVKAHSI